MDAQKMSVPEEPAAAELVDVESVLIDTREPDAAEDHMQKFM